MLNETGQIDELGVVERWKRRRRARAQGPIVVPSIAAQTDVVRLPGGAVRVREVGQGPTLLFVHGLLVDGRVWDRTVAELATDFRCVVPDLPLGSHTLPRSPSADNSPTGVAALLEQLTIAMDLTDVTVVANDSGGAITQLWMDGGASRVSRVVLTPCDCFERFLPPGFSAFQLLPKLPFLVKPILASTRLGFVRRLPIVYGGLTHRRIDDALLRSWLTPLREDAAIGVDAMKFLAGISSKQLAAAAERLTAFDRPVLLAWAPEQGWFPTRHAKRLAQILPDARIVPLEGTGAFASLEQPTALATAIRAFAGAQAATAVAAVPASARR